MQYLPTAFAQLTFAWKLYNYGLNAQIDLERLDEEVTFQGDRMLFVVPNLNFDSDSDLILALENNLTITFGAAVITLNRAREEAGYKIPNTIVSEIDQCICLISQIRNAFAHDIAEPKWEIRNPNARRRYEFGGIKVDLSDVNGAPFAYRHIGGPDVLFHIKDYAAVTLWPDQG